MNTRVPLSFLDLAIVGTARTSADALADCTAMARHADALGLRRFWVAEHHNMPSVASTTPPVLMAHLAAVTDTIEIGSGGVMLPNHPPLVVAEHIAALEALHPGRINLGIGRAPGTDQRTAAALRRGPAHLGVDTFPRDLLDVMGLLGDPRSDTGLWQHFRATPAAATHPKVFLLGSSDYSAQLAGMLGLPFVFAHHFGTGGTDVAVRAYRDRFTPSPVADAPYLVITANALAAATPEEADHQAGPGRVMTRGIRTGRFAPLCTPEQAAAELADARVAADTPMRAGRVVGTAEHVVAQLDRLVADTGADELMISTVAYDRAVRITSLELIARAWQSPTD